MVTLSSASDKMSGEASSSVANLRQASSGLEVTEQTAETAAFAVDSAAPASVQPLESLADLLHRRVTVISEGDNVLLRMPSDAVKTIVASSRGNVSLGKFGSFPASELIGLPYDITYEIVSAGNSTASASNSPAPEAKEGEMKKGKNRGTVWSRGHSEAQLEGHTANGKSVNTLKPLSRQTLQEIEETEATNENIDDDPDISGNVMSPEEIRELREAGVSSEEIIQRQIERHGAFELKTEYSKEKYKRKKEKKFFQTVTPLAPSIPNLLAHYATRSPVTTLHLRHDTMSQMLVQSNIRPGGRYLVVDETGGLVPAAIIERMGAEGQLLLLTELDGPPAFGILNTMNFGEREMACVKWLNWMEAEEDYTKPEPPPEDDLPSANVLKAQARRRRHEQIVTELNATRWELHRGNWDGLVVASLQSPISILNRLTPYLAGSGTVCIYSPYQQLLVETLQYMKRANCYLTPTLSESWSRRYQVLPGRTHPTMATSATGGYLLSALRTLPASTEPYVVGKRRQKQGKPGEGKRKLRKLAEAEASRASDTASADEMAVDEEMASNA